MAKDRNTMTTIEVAAALGVSRATVQRWAKMGILQTINPPSTKLRQRPKYLKFDRAYIEAFSPAAAAPPRLLAEDRAGYDPNAA